MRVILIRLQQGERWWPAELVLRAVGLGMLVLCALSSRWCCRLVSQPPQHPGTPLELAIAAIAFACLSAGIALLVEGPGLFRLVPIPPRAMLP